MRLVIDWRRLRNEALKPLLAGRAATWQPFDDGLWELDTFVEEREPAPLVVLDGSYSAHPELAELIDLAVLVDTPDDVRRRQIARSGTASLERWDAAWEEAADYYFSSVRPASSFDLIVAPDARE